MFYFSRSHKTSLILIQIEENLVLWLKLVANRIFLCGLLPLSTNSDFSVSISDVNKACFADLISCRLRIIHKMETDY